MKLSVDSNAIQKNITPISAAFTGMCLSKISDCFFIGKSNENGFTNSAEASLISGIISGGSDAVLLGTCLEPELFFASKISNIGMCIYLKSDNNNRAQLIIRSKGGLPLLSEKEKKLSNELKRRDTLINTDYSGRISDGSAFKLLYKRMIEKILPAQPDFKISISTSCTKAFSIVPCSENESSDELIIQLSHDGRKAALYSEESSFVCWERLMLVYCRYLAENSQDAAVPYEFPWAADTVARNFGRRIFRYFRNSDGHDEHSRAMALQQSFSMDGIFLACSVLKILTDKKTSLKELINDLPAFYTSKKYLSVSSEKWKTAKIKETEQDNIINTPDGLEIKSDMNRILISPSTSGSGLWLHTESFSMEAASELCEKFERSFKEYKE